MACFHLFFPAQNVPKSTQALLLDSREGIGKRNGECDRKRIQGKGGVKGKVREGRGNLLRGSGRI